MSEISDACKNKENRLSIYLEQVGRNRKTTVALAGLSYYRFLSTNWKV